MPDELCLWQNLEEASREVFSLYNYREIRVPLIEEAKLFNRSLGESAEIVQKQMFLIKNNDELYALRPEGTASIVRAYIENNLDKTQGFSKFYYLGPMFRLERPQKGRLRQFYHIGCEAIGSNDANLDIEIISLADNLLKTFSVEGYKIKINSLGCPKDKKELIALLQKALKNEVSKLCADCQDRYKRNVLRILDCKEEGCRKILSKIDIRSAFLCLDCSAHFEKVKAGLSTLKINYEVLPHLVRGLDYYTRTIFEISHPALGSQDALGAGGRYDNLVKELGGPEVGAIGFAFGVERVLLAAGCKPQAAGKNLVFLVTLGEEARKEGVSLLSKLRESGIAADMDYEGKSLKGAMRTANDLNAKSVLILGEDELKKGVITLKNMQSGEQKEINQTDLVKELKQADCSGCAKC